MGFTGETPQGGVALPNSYVVALKPELTDQEVESHINTIKSLVDNAQSDISGLAGSQTQFDKFSFAPGVDVSDEGEPDVGFRGYMGTFTPNILQEIEESPLVDYIENDQYYQVQDIQPNPSSWGLSRISHLGPFNASRNEYVYDQNESGKGVTCYVIDTGVKIGHQDFGGRARWGKTVVNGAHDTDSHGHGTHVAGTIAGTKHGVAKNASIVAVKVFPDGSGMTSTSDIIKGLDWSLHDAQAKNNTERCVVNMSVGGPYSAVFNSAVEKAVQNGIVVVVAAANSGQNAKGFSPASSPDALTVGAIDRLDAMPSWSNWGRFLDFNAPGVDIVSCGIASATAEATMSGTSMASPHIAGLASCLRQKTEFVPFKSLAYELRLRAEGGCKVFPGHEFGTPNLAAVNSSI
ncbi:subtilisin-like protein [Penicillium samsonianum]|uniref:subtilisin-like protein n=1 Tax=Penicillium samsonianum TaxID=1882272 RepID=UPI002549B168|nr:subtilisin-like protein [Penicillium samsonianum]KAJ6118041.1 subtilisin-like protein [Penicillium samsonianum]